MSTTFFFFLFLSIAWLVVIVVPLSPSKFTTILLGKLPAALYWFKRDRMTWAGVLLDRTTGESWSGRCWSLLSIKPLPFVTLVGIFMVVVAALGLLWCFEAADGVINKGTCSGFSANFSSPHLTFIYIKRTQFSFCAIIAKIFRGPREKRNEKQKLKEKSIFMLFSLRWEFKGKKMEKRILSDGGGKHKKFHQRIFFRVVIPHSEA